MVDQSHDIQTPAPPAGGDGIDYKEVTLKGLDYGRKAIDIIKKSDVLLPIGVLLILGMLLIPLPTWTLDILLAASISISVMVLMVVIFIDAPDDLTAFPTILLLTALLRLGLNVASTRLILSEGHSGTDAAGKVIEAFGSFVAGGNYVIGLIVFAILVIINFVVITKGAGRIAEVAARFSLDSLPGKQMAIDADLSSGLITEQIARERRARLQQEMSFYGSMDGASKFVRGDAIAGLLITFINIIGGIVIGVAQRDMELGVAAQNYTLLTIGDGLVSQIPAIIVSVAAGILITKSGLREQTERAMASQISSNPMALVISSGLLLVLAMIPGLPSSPFLVVFFIVASLSAWIYYSRHRASTALIREIQEKEESADNPIATDEDGQDNKEDMGLAIDAIRVELGYGLLPLVGTKKTKGLYTQVIGLRKQLATKLGFILPMVRIQDNLQLGTNEYLILIKEIPAARGEVRPHLLLCMSPEGGSGKFTIRGEKTTEPAFGLPALWIHENQRDEALFQGYTVIEPVSVIATHVAEIAQNNMAELLSYSETQALIDNLPEKHKAMAKELIPGQINIGALQKILQGLLGERVSIRDLPLILEAVAEASTIKKQTSFLIEWTRSALSRQLSHEFANDRGFISLITISPRWEQIFMESLVTGPDGSQNLSVEPKLAQEFIAKLTQMLQKQAQFNETPNLLVNPTLRPFIRSLLLRQLPQISVLSHNEIHISVKLETAGAVE